ncbi:MAG: glycosyltransferase family 9 protein, partial [Bacteroidaceae bacterium]|nr:glycosyltransferase family 9 protein [Bacteroidaceae bacterium]
LAIGYAPFAAHAGKIYPLDKSFEVIKQLLARGCKIYLFGAGEKELKVFKEWQSKVNSQKSTVDSLTIASEVLAAEGKKGFKAELELMSTLDCMVTMDSGNMHLASIVGTRVVSVWGATHPLAGFLGWQQDIADCVQVDLPCRPCSIYGKKPCKHGDYPCLNNITPEQIVERVLGS